MRGEDPSVRRATPQETEDAVKAVKELEELGSNTKLLVVSFQNPAAEYVIAPPRPSPSIPVGRWTRTSIGYDIRGVHVATL